MCVAQHFSIHVRRVSFNRTWVTPQLIKVNLYLYVHQKGVAGGFVSCHSAIILLLRVFS